MNTARTKKQLCLRGPVQAESELLPLLDDLLAGRSLKFLEVLIAIVTEGGLMERYVGRMILNDCQCIRELYERCLCRNFELKQTLGLPSALIEQHDLDDYLVKAAFAKKRAENEFDTGGGE